MSLEGGREVRRGGEGRGGEGREGGRGWGREGRDDCYTYYSDGTTAFLYTAGRLPTINMGRPFS